MTCLAATSFAFFFSSMVPDQAVATLSLAITFVVMSVSTVYAILIKWDMTCNNSFTTVVVLDVCWFVCQSAQSTNIPSMACLDQCVSIWIRGLDFVLFVCQPVCPSTCLSLYLSVPLPVCPSTCLSNLILRGILLVQCSVHHAADPLLLYCKCLK